MPITGAFVNQLAEEARTNHPALRAAKARVDAARSNEQSIRRWEDPMARFGVMPAQREMRVEDGDLLFGVEQKLPLFGKPQAAQRVAVRETGVAQANSDFEFQQLRKNIAQAVFKTALAERALEIATQDINWLKTMLAVTEQRYETGEATQIEVLRLQNDYARRLNESKTDEKLVEHQRVNLNRLLGRDLQSAWPKLELPQIATVQYEPKLKMLHREINRAEAITDQARRQRYPDLSVGGEMRYYSGNGEYRQGMLTLSLSLPWGNRKKYNADIQRAEWQRKASEFDAADYELEIRNEVHELTTKIDAARREALLYRDEIIPRSEAALDSARVAWEANRGMFRDVLDARRMLLDAQFVSARAVAEQYEMLSELVLCCGLGDLEALQMIGSQPDSKTPIN
jgi:cobalt-zinc-cadmium efflux system outer membrane protein